MLFSMVDKVWRRLTGLIPTNLKERLMANVIFRILHDFILSLIFGFLFIPFSLRGNGVLISPKDKVWISVPSLRGALYFAEIFRLHIYEQVFKVEKGEIVIDIGAHVGIFTIKAARKVGEEGRVLAIEPEPHNLALLRRNTKSLPNVTIIPLACGDYRGRTKLYISRFSGEHSLKFNAKLGEIEVEIDTLENITANSGINEVNFIKIDAEGAELEVLKGAGRLLEKSGIKLAIASYHYPEQANEIEEFLALKGFKVVKEKEGRFIYAQKP